MPQTILEMAKELVQAQIRAGGLVSGSITVAAALKNAHAALLEIQAVESGDVASSEVFAARPDWRKSIRKHHITCLECGASSKQLSWRHLLTHDLDPRSYRVKYGIPQDQNLSAKATTARRRAAVQRIRPWELAPGWKRTASRADLKAVPKKRKRQA